MNLKKESRFLDEELKAQKRRFEEQNRKKKDGIPRLRDRKKVIDFLNDMKEHPNKHIEKNGAILTVCMVSAMVLGSLITIGTLSYVQTTNPLNNFMSAFSLTIGITVPLFNLSFTFFDVCYIKHEEYDDIVQTFSKDSLQRTISYWEYLRFLKKYRKYKKHINQYN